MVGKGWAVGEQQEGRPSHLGGYYSWYYPDHDGYCGAGIRHLPIPCPQRRSPSRFRLQCSSCLSACSQPCPRSR